MAKKYTGLIMVFCTLLYGCASTKPVYGGATSSPDTCSDGLAPIYFVEGTSKLKSISSRSLGNATWIFQNCKVKRIEVVGLTQPIDDSLNSKKSRAVLEFLSLFGVEYIKFDNRVAMDDEMMMIQWQSSPRDLSAK